MIKISFKDFNVTKVDSSNVLEENVRNEEDPPDATLEAISKDLCDISLDGFKVPIIGNNLTQGPVVDEDKLTMMSNYVYEDEDNHEGISSSFQSFSLESLVWIGILVYLMLILIYFLSKTN